MQTDDNLFRIAFNTGFPLAELQRINCISDASRIETGQELWLPPGSTALLQNAQNAAQTSIPSTAAPDLPPLRQGCTANLNISAPEPGSGLSQPFFVRGTAQFADPAQFQFYKVEIQRVGSSQIGVLQENIQPATGSADPLTRNPVNPDDFGPGIYLISLTVVDITGNYPPPCTIRVAFE